MQIALMSNKRNIEIALHDLKTLIQIPEEESIDIDTTNLLHATLPQTALDDYLQSATQREILRIARKKEEISFTDRRIIKSNFYPTINLFAKYAFNYPNYMFFPPNPYLYTLGSIGIELNYSISNIYKNKTKMHMANKRIELARNERLMVEDKINDQVFTQYTQYRDILDRIPVNEKSVQQATENYRIIKVKYLNQLALITDMIDADNALLQTKYNTISTRIDAIMKYHELLHACGLSDSNLH
jgi:outer membrane protein